jgi:hypothetical protein
MQASVRSLHKFGCGRVSKDEDDAIGTIAASWFETAQERASSP